MTDGPEPPAWPVIEGPGPSAVPQTPQIAEVCPTDLFQ